MCFWKRYFPVNGEWSVWGAWGTCSLTCGGGQASRARTCSDPYPANGGLDCVGTSSEFGTCNNDSCPTVPPGTYVNVSKISKLNEWLLFLIIIVRRHAV